jgi:chromosome segregation and condensation protein ScpB
VSAEDEEHSGQPSTSKTTEKFEKNLRIHQQRLLPNNP